MERGVALIDCGGRRDEDQGATGERARAREFLLRFGRNAATYQVINPVIQKWFAPDQSAMIGFVRHAKTRIVAGGPISESRDRRWVAEAFQGLEPSDVCYFGVEEQFADEWVDGAATRVCIGAQPCWRPADWERTVMASASLRAQFNRARNKGVRVEEWTTDRAETSEELKQVLQGWLETRGLPPLHFLVEPETLDFLRDRRTFVALRGGQVVAFLNLCPVPVRNGWMTEQFPRLPSAPNGTVELLMHEAVLTLGREGAEFVTMGMVPLTRRVESGQGPIWFRFFAKWARAHFVRFYNFAGLESFKTKFHPHWWEPLLLIVPDRRLRFRHAWAVAAAFADGPVLRAVVRSLGRAVVLTFRRR